MRVPRVFATCTTGANATMKSISSSTPGAAWSPSKSRAVVLRWRMPEQRLFAPRSNRNGHCWTGRRRGTRRFSGATGRILADRLALERDPKKVRSKVCSDIPRSNVHQGEWQERKGGEDSKTATAARTLNRTRSHGGRTAHACTGTARYAVSGWSRRPRLPPCLVAFVAEESSSAILPSIDGPVTVHCLFRTPRARISGSDRPPRKPFLPLLRPTSFGEKKKCADNKQR